MAVGILAAAYFFVVKPVLSTTEKAIETTNQSFARSLGVEGVDLTDISGTIEDVNRQVQREIRRSFKTAEKKGNPKRLVRCIERSHGNVKKIERCTRKF